MKRFWLALLLFTVAPLDGQVDLGVTGGVPLTPFILNRVVYDRSGSSQVASALRRYTVGPYIEFHVRGPVGIETGALYKRFGFDSASRGFYTAERSTTTGNSWEFPILAKVHLRFLSRVNGLVSAGPSLRRLTGVTEMGERTMYPVCPPPCATQIIGYKTDSPVWLDRRTSVGAAFGAGIEFHLGMLRLDPSFRVTRWDSERTSSIGVTSRLAKTQAEVLLTVAHSVSGGRETPPARIPCCFEFGLLAGLPLLAASDVRSGVPGFPTSLDAPAYRYAVGALLDWRLQTRLSLEASFLTRPFGHTATTVYPSITDKESVSGYSWEVPLLLKWRAAKLRSATFVIGAGPVLLRASNAESTMTTSGSMFNSRFSEPLIVQSAIGATVSGGIELKAGRLRLRQEIRYQWFERPLYDFYFVKPRQDSLFVIFAVSQITR